MPGATCEEHLMTIGFHYVCPLPNRVASVIASERSQQGVFSELLLSYRHIHLGLLELKLPHGLLRSSRNPNCLAPDLDILRLEAGMACSIPSLLEIYQCLLGIWPNPTHHWTTLKPTAPLLHILEGIVVRKYNDPGCSVEHFFASR